MRSPVRAAKAATLLFLGAALSLSPAPVSIDTASAHKPGRRPSTGPTQRPSGLPQLQQLQHQLQQFLLQQQLQEQRQNDTGRPPPPAPAVQPPPAPAALPPGWPGLVQPGLGAPGLTAFVPNQGVANFDGSLYFPAGFDPANLATQGGDGWAANTLGLNTENYLQSVADYLGGLNAGPSRAEQEALQAPLFAELVNDIPATDLAAAASSGAPLPPPPGDIGDVASEIDPEIALGLAYITALQGLDLAAGEGIRPADWEGDIRWAALEWVLTGERPATDSSERRRQEQPATPAPTAEDVKRDFVDDMLDIGLGGGGPAPATPESTRLVQRYPDGTTVDLLYTRDPETGAMTVDRMMFDDKGNYVGADNFTLDRGGDPIAHSGDRQVTEFTSTHTGQDKQLTADELDAHDARMGERLLDAMQQTSAEPAAGAVDQSGEAPGSSATGTMAATSVSQAEASRAAASTATAERHIEFFIEAATDPMVGALSLGNL
jgi:hypothetical protein